MGTVVIVVPEEGVCVCVRLAGGTHSLVAVGTEEACMVAFLHNNVGDAWLVLLLQAYTGLTNGQQLIIQHLRKKKKQFSFKLSSKKTQSTIYSVHCKTYIL